MRIEHRDERTPLLSHMGQTKPYACRLTPSPNEQCRYGRLAARRPDVEVLIEGADASAADASYWVSPQGLRLHATLSQIGAVNPEVTRIFAREVTSRTGMPKN